MKTSVIGFPRIGTLRELKFTLEKYFRKEIDVKELLQTAQTKWMKDKRKVIQKMKISDIYKDNKRSLSFEIFPPKKDSELKNIDETLSILC